MTKTNITAKGVSVESKKKFDELRGKTSQADFFEYLMDIAVLYDKETMQALETATSTGRYTKTQIIADAVKKSAKGIANRVEALNSGEVDSMFEGAQKRVDDVVRAIMASNDKAKSQWDKVYITASYFYSDEGKQVVESVTDGKYKSVNRKAVREYLELPSIQSMLEAHNAKHGMEDKSHNHIAKIKKRFS